MMEGCSVCICEEDEIPKPWLQTEVGKNRQKDEYGWITADSLYGFDGVGQDDALGRIAVAEGESADLRLDSMYLDNGAGAGRNGVVEVNLGAANGIQTELEEEDDDESGTSLHPQYIKPMYLVTEPVYIMHCGHR